MISKEILNIILYRRSLGESIRQIAKNLNIKKASVDSIIYYKNKVHKKKRGPKNKIQKSDSINIKRSISKESDMSHKINCNKILQLTDIPVSRRTMNNWMLTNDMRYQHAAQKITLSKEHKAERIRIVSTWIENNVDWSNAIFVDEKRFSLDGPDNWLDPKFLCDLYYIYNRFTYVKKGQNIMRQKRQSNGGGVMVWGMVMPNGLIAVTLMEGRQNSDKYIDLFKSFAVPIMNLNYEQGYSIIQDNCTIHVSRKFRTYASQQAFEVWEWPSRSPDLNIMENVWKMISDLVYKDSQPRNIKELTIKIHKAVLEINSHRRTTTIALHSNFRSRLTKILLCKGETIN